MNKKFAKLDHDVTNQTGDLILTSGIGSRINEAAKGLGGTRNLAEVIGISEAQLYRITSEKSQPKVEAVAAVAEATGVNLQWLVTGQGSMRPSSAPKTMQNGEFDLVSLYDVQVSAGHGAHIESEDVIAQIAFRHDWLMQNGFNINNLVSLNARGDSMSPTVNDGDMLLIDTSQKDVAEDGIYVLRVDSHLLAKRLQRLLDGTIYIKSDNPAYERQEVSKDDTQQLQVIGRVVWSGRRM